jgi:5-deoxy-glucuronate isomerase
LFFSTGLRGDREPPDAEMYGPAPEGSREIGEGSYRRLVTPLIAAGAGSIGLTLGETYNPPGCWSTYPPHRHDRHRLEGDPEGPETQQGEVYVFRFTPVHGFGLARIYEEKAGVPGSDQTLVFEHGDALAILQGYHTVCAAPGYHLHYLWALAGQHPGPSRNRRDPAHTWVEEQT